MGGLFGTYKNMCGKGGVSEIFVYSRILRFTWETDAAGEVSVGIDSAPGDTGDWRRVGP